MSPVIGSWLESLLTVLVFSCSLSFGFIIWPHSCLYSGVAHTRIHIGLSFAIVTQCLLCTAEGTVACQPGILKLDGRGKMPIKKGAECWVSPIVAVLTGYLGLVMFQGMAPAWTERW